jgi:hypothetical protein
VRTFFLSFVNEQFPHDSNRIAFVRRLNVHSTRSARSGRPWIDSA